MSEIDRTAQCPRTSVAHHSHVEADWDAQAASNQLGIGSAPRIYRHPGLPHHAGASSPPRAARNKTAMGAEGTQKNQAAIGRQTGGSP
jgi:hypothetical protein